MSKYSTEFKLKIVEHYLQTKCSKKSLARIFNVSRSDVQKWIALYENQGVEGFVSVYTNYTVEFKLGILNFMIETGTSLIETAAIFNIPAPSTILRWKKLLEEQGVDALQSKKRGHPSMKKETKKTQLTEGSQEALLAEIERLRMENAYLKKLNALVQKERQSQNAKKHK
ncbi:IS3 family transposase [Metabacillus fastidiosus]|uniref:IS3 family transposase n=1 Tax=Metabacillus fastidiosus TaxID=1458 RepID=A0ABU6NZJ5_9BACI|nr:IS3 family transposase [Metabacillus fastidiosus]MED4402451.1 IS3 family transposase [Metabacillus fastidiosus]MED4461738.1 IS3 family transposase [Metabacillus fastidiosus]